MAKEKGRDGTKEYKEGEEDAGFVRGELDAVRKIIEGRLLILVAASKKRPYY